MELNEILKRKDFTKKDEEWLDKASEHMRALSITINAEEFADACAKVVADPLVRVLLSAVDENMEQIVIVALSKLCANLFGEKMDKHAEELGYDPFAPRKDEEKKEKTE